MRSETIISIILCKVIKVKIVSTLRTNMSWHRWRYRTVQELRRRGKSRIDIKKSSFQRWIWYQQIRRMMFIRNLRRTKSSRTQHSLLLRRQSRIDFLPPMFSTQAPTKQHQAKRPWKKVLKNWALGKSSCTTSWRSHNKPYRSNHHRSSGKLWNLLQLKKYQIQISYLVMRNLIHTKWKRKCKR